MSIRKAALDLYTPPFRYAHGYVFDANNQMVADDGGSEVAGLIATRIRGWGRIQYMDNPRGRAEALQDEVGHIVAEALNAHWAKARPTGESQAEVRKQDEALIRQMLDALETYQNFIDDAHIIDCQYHWIDGLQDVAKDARARLGEGGAT